MTAAMVYTKQRVEKEIKKANEIKIGYQKWKAIKTDDFIDKK